MSITWKIDGKTDMVTVTIPGNTLLSIVNHATINMQTLLQEIDTIQQSPQYANECDEYHKALTYLQKDFYAKFSEWDCFLLELQTTLNKATPFSD